MPPSQTPAPLSLLWFGAHGMSPFFRQAFIDAEPGLLICAGSSGFAMGVTSVQFDDATGEPLVFETNSAISLATEPTFLGVWHFPAEQCVVIAGYKTTATAGDTRVWARRVYYDSAGNL